MALIKNRRAPGTSGPVASRSERTKSAAGRGVASKYMTPNEKGAQKKLAGKKGRAAKSSDK